MAATHANSSYVWLKKKRFPLFWYKFPLFKAFLHWRKVFSLFAANHAEYSYMLLMTTFSLFRSHKLRSFQLYHTKRFFPPVAVELSCFIAPKGAFLLVCS